MNAFEVRGLLRELTDTVPTLAVTAGSFAQCVQLAANYDGDSDSTASIAGQLYGARYGLEVLPADAVARLDGIEPLCCVMGSFCEPRTAQY